MISPLLLAAATTAAPVAAPAAKAETMSLQQSFDMASDLAAQHKCAEALVAFDRIGADPRIKPDGLPAAAIAVRKGICLADLGRREEAEASILAGLPKLEAAGESFGLDVAQAHMALGNIAYIRSDRARAADHFRASLRTLTGAARLPGLARLANAMAFDGGTAAIDTADEALRILAEAPKPDKETQATFYTLRGRALLNQGRNDEAYEDLKTALALSGGLTLRTSLAEVALRSDLATAAMLVKRKQDAQRYMAYTGAGRIGETPFTRAESMPPPPCGSETGLRPEDLAVVQFSIGDDGYVRGAETVYSRGGPQVAAAFEQAVAEWYWEAEDIAKVPPFYRVLTRVELRCSNAAGDRPGLWAPLDTRFEDWAARRLPGDLPEERPARLARLRQIAADAAGSAQARAAALGMLAKLDATAAPADRLAAFDRALELAAGLPQHVPNWLRIKRFVLAQEDRKRKEPKRQAALAMAAEPAIAGDALAADTLRLFAGDVGENRRPEEADALVRAVADDDRLEAHHPLRQLAWLTLADRAAKAKDTAAAQTYFDRTGLTEEQCALIDLPPAMRSPNLSSTAYPTSALEMGFEGWVHVEMDVSADGRTTNVRPVVAYPPLIFAEAAKSIGEGVRYEWSYRPRGATACSAANTSVNFQMR